MDGPLFCGECHKETDGGTICSKCAPVQQGQADDPIMIRCPECATHHRLFALHESFVRVLTLEEKATNAETRDHILEVTRRIHQVVTELLKRGPDHDESKLEDPEVEAFTRMTSKLKGLTYGSSEYSASLVELGPAIQHHYQNNRHHIEFHGDKGVSGMNLIDFVELLCDWKSASQRHADGNILKSLEINAVRFKLEPQVVALLRNTVIDLGWDT